MWVHSGRHVPAEALTLDDSCAHAIYALGHEAAPLAHALLLLRVNIHLAFLPHNLGLSRIRGNRHSSHQHATL
jgi:hypothetical protein